MPVQVSVSMGRSGKQEAKLLPLDSVQKLVASAEALTTEERRALPVGLFSVPLVDPVKSLAFSII